MKLTEKKLKVFIPDYLPLENKGEEAILRGIEDILSQNGFSIKFYILSVKCKQKYLEKDITFYPYSWWQSLWFTPWRTKVIQMRFFSVSDLYSIASYIFKKVLDWIFPNWVTIMPFRIRLLQWISKNKYGIRKLFPGQYEMLRELKNIDIIIAGHDGVFNTQYCHILGMARYLGLKYCILGSDFKYNSNLTRKIEKLYEKNLSNALFLGFRDKISFKSIQKKLPNLGKIVLVPDPAFAMKPAKEEEIDCIIKKENLNEFFLSQVVMITVTENNAIRKLAFRKELAISKKMRFHSYLIANLVQHILDKWDVSVIFLPHSIGPTKELDDRQVAEKIVKLIKNKRNKIKIIKNEYNARELKGLIKRSDFLIGERIHSLIGAVGVNTPFICLGSNDDPRVTGIIGDMCQRSDCIYYLDRPNVKELCLFFDNIWIRKNSIKEELRNISLDLQEKAYDIGKEMLNYTRE